MPGSWATPILEQLFRLKISLKSQVSSLTLGIIPEARLRLETFCF
jgi:hypothetical protein